MDVDVFDLYPDIFTVDSKVTCCAIQPNVCMLSGYLGRTGDHSDAQYGGDFKYLVFFLLFKAK